MEKSKVKRICIEVGKWALFAALVAVAFALSVWAGISAIVFFVYGFLVGWYNVNTRIAKKVLEQFTPYQEDFFKGKKIVITSSDNGEVSFQAVEGTSKKDKVKKEE